MKKIKFLIKYSKEFEIQRVLSTKKKLKWYSDNGYNLNNFTLPKGLSVEELSKSSEAEIISYINEEYDSEFFQPHAQTVNSLLPNYLNKLADYFLGINVKILPNIEIKLTRYGIGGSYNIPNTVIINTSKLFNIGLVRVVLHEIIHLHIQNLIDKYEIGQWEKEIIVDGIFEKFSVDIFKRQNYPIEASKIQKIFKENHPKIELIVHNVSLLKR